MADELHSPLARRLSAQFSSPSPSEPRLKRLSLVAARDGTFSLGSPVRAGTPRRPSDEEDEGRASVDSLRTPVAASPSPRPRHSGRQSSISYSPSIRHGAQGSLSLRREWERATPSPLEEEKKEEEGRRSTDTLTLGEKCVPGGVGLTAGTRTSSA
jgi:hypothetical protein